MEPAAGRLVDRRGPSGPPGDRGVAVGRDAHVRASSRAAPHQLVHALRSRGFAPGDTIAYDLPNGVDIVVWQMATQESGLRSISLNPSSSAAEIHRILEHSGATGLVLHHRFADRAAEATTFDPAAARCSRCEGDIDGFDPQEAFVAGHPTTAPDDRRLGGSDQLLVGHDR